MSNIKSDGDSHKFRVPKCYQNDSKAIKRRAKAEEKKQFDNDIAFLNEYSETLKKLERQGYKITQNQKDAVRKAKKKMWKNHKRERNW
jgi:hypothetical protein